MINWLVTVTVALPLVELKAIVNLFTRPNVDAIRKLVEPSSRCAEPFWTAPLDVRSALKARVQEVRTVVRRSLYNTVSLTFRKLIFPPTSVRSPDPVPAPRDCYLTYCYKVCIDRGVVS